MSGLLVKDFRLMLQRKKFFLLILMITVGLLLNSDYNFIFSYLTVIAAMVSLSTLSYDEAENCYAFLMTMPVERKNYVRGKYLFCLFCGILGWTAGAAVCAAGVLLKMPAVENFSYRSIMETLLNIAVGLLILDIALPFQLKFGAEKGRLMAVVMFGAFAAVGVGMMKLMKSTPMPDGLRRATEKLQMFFEKTDEGSLVAIGIGVVLVLTCISMAISRRIMERKEF